MEKSGMLSSVPDFFVCRRHRTRVASYAGQPSVARNDWALDGNKNGNDAVGIG